MSNTACGEQREIRHTGGALETGCGRSRKEPHHNQTLKYVNYFIERYHYRKTRLDDPLSSRILDRYLDALDANRIYFLAVDIESFETLRFELDDYLGSHNSDPLFTIFNRYRDRIIERIDYALGRLNQPFDFSANEAYPFDRTEAPWAIDGAALDDLWRRRVKNDYLILKLEGKPHEENPKQLEKEQKFRRDDAKLDNPDDSKELADKAVRVCAPLMLCMLAHPLD